MKKIILAITMLGVLIFVAFTFGVFPSERSTNECDVSMNKILKEQSDLILYNDSKTYEFALESAKKMITLSHEVALNCKDVPGRMTQDKIKESTKEYISLVKQFEKKIADIEKFNELQRAEADRLLAEMKKNNSTEKVTRVERATRVKKRSIIMKNCMAKWGNDYQMVKYCKNKQTAAKHFVASQHNDEIKGRCSNKWGTDYQMVKYCITKQRTAKRSLGL